MTCDWNEWPKQGIEWRFKLVHSAQNLWNWPLVNCWAISTCVCWSLDIEIMTQKHWYHTGFKLQHSESPWDLHQFCKWRLPGQVCSEAPKTNGSEKHAEYVASGFDEKRPVVSGLFRCLSGEVTGWRWNLTYLQSTKTYLRFILPDSCPLVNYNMKTAGKISPF